MTFEAFKDELYMIKINSRAIISKLKSLEDIEEETTMILGTGAIDYSAERLTSTHDPDAAAIIKIDMLRKKREELLDQITELRESDRRAVELIMSVPGIGGEVLRLFYIEDMRIRSIAKRLNYEEQYCWQMLRKERKSLYERVKESCTGY